MLTELSIRDMAIISRITIRFGPGLHVLSGETGAGKSLLTGGLRLLLGDRAGSETVRAGAERAVVEGVFELDPEGWVVDALRELDIEAEDGELILRREIVPGGQGRCRANGRAIPRSALVRAGEFLIDLHGQHDHQSLLRPSFQLDMLDAFAGLLGLRAGFAAAFDELRAAIAELESAEEALRDCREREEWVRFQWKELEDAAVQPGELAESRTLRSRLEQAEFLRETSSRLVDTLRERDGSIHDEVAALEGAAAEAARHDPQWEALAEGLAEVVVRVGDLADDARRAGDGAVDDPARLEEVRGRIRRIEDLLVKYGPEEEDLLREQKRLAEEVADPQAARERVGGLRERVGKISATIAAAGADLTARRQEAASQLDAAVEDALKSLGMRGTVFRTLVRPLEKGEVVCIGEDRPKASRRGFDEGEFLLSANPGEKPGALRAIASGGEISRVMLALKSALGTTRCPGTMVFDEIDAGIGGVVAGRVAEMLAELSSRGQVISITHLAPIAARATTHFAVRKVERENRTLSLVEPVEGEERVREVARMLGGGDGAAVEHARELLGAVAP